MVPSPARTARISWLNSASMAHSGRGSGLSRSSGARFDIGPGDVWTGRSPRASLFQQKRFYGPNRAGKAAQSETGLMPKLILAGPQTANRAGRSCVSLNRQGPQVQERKYYEERFWARPELL